MRLTCFATNASGRPIAELELRHRLRVRAENRIRTARPPACATSPEAHSPEPDPPGDRTGRARPAGLDADAGADRQGQAQGTPLSAAQPAVVADAAVEEAALEHGVSAAPDALALDHALGGVDDGSDAEPAG